MADGRFERNVVYTRQLPSHISANRFWSAGQQIAEGVDVRFDCVFARIDKKRSVGKLKDAKCFHISSLFIRREIRALLN